MVNGRSVHWWSVLAALLVTGCNDRPAANTNPAAIPLGTNTPSARAEDGSTDAPKDTTRKKLRIAVIPKGTTHEFWKSVHYGALKAAREFGNVEIIWKGSQLESDRVGQIGVFNDFVTQRVDGICLAPLDSGALVEYVRDAKEQGIPVVIFDSGLDDPTPIVSYVATDNKAGGRLAAHELAKAMGRKGKVILLRYTKGSESTQLREDGFLETLKYNYPEIQVLSDDQYSDTTPQGSMAVCQTLFVKFRKEVTGCFAVCEPNATGMFRALEEEGLAGRVKFIAFDPAPNLIKGMKEGKVHGIVLQDPVRMGYLAVKTCVDHINGKSVDRNVGTGEYIATPENMNEPRMKELLSPPQEGEG
jgi:ribose transport system substrate-binding protein